MKREIKFRLWIEDAKEFSYLADLQGKNHSVRAGESGRGDDYVQWNIYSSTPVVWQQFTGLKDTKGKEIYEGDIIRVGQERDIRCIGQVVYQFGSFTLVGKYSVPFRDSYMNLIRGEVVGNIFENPELLK